MKILNTIPQYLYFNNNILSTSGSGSRRSLHLSKSNDTTQYSVTSKSISKYKQGNVFTVLKVKVLKYNNV